MLDFTKIYLLAKRWKTNNGKENEENIEDERISEIDRIIDSIDTDATLDNYRDISGDGSWGEGGNGAAYGRGVLKGFTIGGKKGDNVKAIKSLEEKKKRRKTLIKTIVKMIRFLILIILFMLIQSCYKSEDIKNELYELYGDDKASINDVEIKTIFLTDDDLTKVKNLFLMNSLYIEKDSLLRIKDEKYKEQHKLDSSCSTKMNENRTKLNRNKREHIQLITEINEEMKNFRFETKNSLKYYVLWYKKNHGKKYSMILDKNFNIVFSQDPLLEIR